MALVRWASAVVADAEGIADGLRAITQPGEAFEIRIPRAAPGGTISGYFAEPDVAVQALASLKTKAQGVYVTLNPVRRDVMARAHRRLKSFASTTTSDREIIRRRWIPLDIDPVRPAGVSATDEEHRGAQEAAVAIRDYLRDFGFPDPLVLDSGNGFWLLIGVELPNDAATQMVVTDFLRAVSRAFSSAVVTVDTSVGNAGRLMKIPGTWARKGDDMPERPHRVVRLEAAPKRAVAGLDLIRAVIEDAKPETHSAPHLSLVRGADWIEDAAAWLSRHGIEYREKPGQAGTRRFELRACPFGDHEWPYKAFVMHHSDGRIAAGCLTDKHSGMGLREMRVAVEGSLLTPREGYDSGHTETRMADEVDDTDDAEGDEPGPLLDTRVERFPVDVFPAKLQAFIRATAEAVCCPPDFVAAPLLVYAGAAIGNGAYLRIKQGWQEYARMWLAIVGEPGDRKSPALAKVHQVYEERQRKLYADWETEHQEWERNAERSSVTEPVLKQLFTSDVTIEALGDLLRANRRGILINREELSGWALAMNEYKKRGADRQQWLSLWSGASLMVNRRNRARALYVERPFVSVVGGIQPDVLEVLCDERGRNDGFVHRLLFVYPDRVRHEWTWSQVGEEAFRPVRQLFDGSLGVGAEDGLAVEFTNEARAVWETFIRRHYAESEERLFPDALRGPWAKLDGYAAKLALIMHFIRYAFDRTKDENRCDAESLEAAIKLIGYFKSHLRRVYARLVAHPDDLRTTRLVGWIRERNGTCTVRELLRSGVTGIRTKGEAREALAELERGEWGKIEETASARGLPTVRFTLHTRQLTKCPPAGNEAV